MTQPLNDQGACIHCEQCPHGMEMMQGIAFGPVTPAEIQKIMDSVGHGKTNWQALGFELSGLTLTHERAKGALESLKGHRERMHQALGRPVTFKTAAMDLLDQLKTGGCTEEIAPPLPYGRLSQLAFIDDLTGLANYRNLMNHLENEVKRAGRYGRVFSLLMMDLDGFKGLNDRFGHPAGNAALKTVARMLTFRDSDKPGRFGGDEFAVLLPETPRHIAEELAERLRATVSSDPFMYEGKKTGPLTLSIGVATFPRDGQDAEKLLAAADQALFDAKRAGRNRVRFHIPRTTVGLEFTNDNPLALQSVHVVGTMNGWDLNADPLVWDAAKNAYQRKLALSPGRYEYKFVINRVWYVPDPANPHTVPDGFGDWNSVLTVHATDDHPGLKTPTPGS